MAIVRCCWRRWWTQIAFAEPAIGPPTGPTSGRPPGAVAWTESTKLTVKPSKTSMSIHWSVMPGNVYAATLRGNQILLSKDANPTFMGYSVGHWEGDTLVVETEGYNDKTWLDFSGHPHTDALHVTERLHRRDIGHMDVQFTFDDPKAYTKPWTVKIDPVLFVDGDLLESVCTENEKDLHHLVGK